MSVLVFHPDQDRLQMLSFCLESQLDVQVKAASNIQQTLLHLTSDHQIDCIVTGNREQSYLLFKDLANARFNIPVFYVQASKEETPIAYPGISIAAKLNFAEAVEQLSATIYQKVALNPNLSSDDFCRINLNLLTKVVPLTNDVFVKLAEGKYVKLYNAGSTFTKNDLEKIWSVKKIEHLYIHKVAAKEFLAKIFVAIDKVPTATTLTTTEDPLQLVKDMQETVQELTGKLGFNYEVVRMAQKSVENVVRLIGVSPKLNKLVFSNIMKNKNYLSEHCILTAHISCCIASKLDWPMDSTFHKLAMAAFLHDITIKNPAHAKVRSHAALMEIKGHISAVEFENLKNHPFDVGSLVSKIPEIPNDVWTIITQHHEQPLGNGFPRGMHAIAIAPLAAVFIVAEDMVDEYDIKGDNFDFQEFIKTKQNLYSQGTFKKIAKILSDLK